MPSLEMFVVGRTKLRDVKGLPDLPNLRLLSVVYNEVTSLDDLLIFLRCARCMSTPTS
ncbi:MAG: hypothetical protein IPJ61_18215 [Tessaracoccus sp.]|uniref:hypothetical protein n=1 Tax=Tessaracoccus sp. TaxID=1971211 RepID=UPI001ED592CE|nr:hypothetical protein [Tessaracoccus sp.]MBK7822919.1 hypothetical protein [Tessaracoccus sp.]